MNLPSATVFYVVGASGSGKDSLLRAFKQRYLDTPKADSEGMERKHDTPVLPVAIAHRCITRPKSDGEDSVYLSEAEFNLRVSRQLFALHWKANNYCYGIGCEINQWLASGLSVIVNGSREYWPQAKQIYQQQLQTIIVDVPDALLLKRLHKRDRESEHEINRRMDRHRQLAPSFVADHVIDNAGSLEVASAHLYEVVTSVRGLTITPPRLNKIQLPR